MKYLEEKKNFIFKNCSWAKVSFKSHRTIGANESLYDKLALSYSILSIIMNWNLDVKRTIGAIYHPNGTIQFLSPQDHFVGYSHYRGDIFGKYLDIFSIITQKKNPTRLEKKILQAIHIFGLSRLTRKTEIRFLLLISAFESLLLTSNDRDYLGKKLSEKTAFLLEDNLDKRLKLYLLMKKYYGKRSSLVHGGKSKIDEEYERTANLIFESLIFKLLELTKQYDKMEQKNPNKSGDKDGVEDLINKLKFS